MPSVIVIFASLRQADSPSIGSSDRAAIGLAVSRFAAPAIGYYPAEDRFALKYGAAAKLATLEPLEAASISNFDVAFIGQSALANVGGELAGVLAEKSNATLVFDVLDVHRQGSQLKIIKDVGQGNREEWTVAGPVVIVVSAEAVRPPYVSRYRRMMAAKDLASCCTTQQSTDGKAEHRWERTRPRAKLGGPPKLPAGAAEDRMSAAFGIEAASRSSTNNHLIVADAATCARHLIKYLAHHGFLPSAADKSAADHAVDSTVVQPVQPAKTSSHGEVVSLPQRASRGPRTAGDSPSRLSRRPRIAQAAFSSPPNMAPEQRVARPIGRSWDGLARRPRRV